MGQDQIPTYHLAPNFSIGPAPNGPIELGSIIKNLQNVEVLNDECRLDIPQAKIYCHHKRGFTATQSKMRKGEYGVWAQFLGVGGVGGELSWAHNKSEEDVYKFKREDTIYFMPNLEYMKASMKEKDVAEWVEGTDFEPVYMVTGLKIAHGPSVNMKKSNKWEFVGKLGLQQPGGLPVEVRPKINPSAEHKMDETWEQSDDFIVGIRVKKLVYKKAWFSRNKYGGLESSEYNKGARLVDASELGKKDEDEDEVLEVPFDEELEGKDEVPEIDDGVETSWIVPRLNAT